MHLPAFAFEICTKIIIKKKTVNLSDFGTGGGDRKNVIHDGRRDPFDSFLQSV